jgi:hypothetical protein
MQEASLPLPEQIENARASLPEMSRRGRARYAKLMLAPRPARRRRLLRLRHDRTLAALVGMVGSR